MTVFQFSQSFPDTKSCENDFKIQREQQGITCKKCNHTEHYWLQNKQQWQCKHCKFRTTLTSGTFMEGSKLSIYKWYKVMHLMTFSKKGLSTKEIQTQVGQKRYESIWNLCHKIRTAMGNREDKYILKGMAEFDESFFSIEMTSEARKNNKAGKGSLGTISVGVIVESTPLEEVETGKISSQMGYVKMKVLEKNKMEDIDKLIKENVKNDTVIFSDKSTTYNNIKENVEQHITEVSTSKTTNTTLKWVHTSISNAKKLFNGKHHKINKKYLQKYLDEFCYLLNRRYFNDKIFNRLIIAVIN